MKLPRRTALVALFALSTLALFAGTAGAAAKPKPLKLIHPPANVKIGRVAFAQTPWGRPALLVAVRYPIQAGGRVLRIGVRVAGAAGSAPLTQVVSERVSSGPPRLADRRRTVTFVHEIDLKPRLAQRVEAARKEGRSPTVTVEAQGGIDIDGDGKPDIRSKGVPRRSLRLPLQTLSAAGSAAPGGGSKPFCASVPLVTVAPGARVQVPLPACTTAVHWGFVGKPTSGGVQLTGKHLAFTASSQPGTESIRLNNGTVVVKVARTWGSPAALSATPNAGPVVRAMGDSVTAGFGYYGSGSLMPFTSLYECKPFGTVLDDACSSNSTATKNGLKEVPYLADYGLSNNVSWAAQWANKYGVTNYKNYAISGSEPTNWAPGGNLYPATQKIEAENPDYILMTIGANPILANTLLGLGPARCALEADLFGGYEECVKEAFESVHLRAELKSLYTDLVQKTSATIYLMQYHLSIPSSAIAFSVTQIAQMAKMMNETIAEVAKEVSPTRLQVVTPPHFNVGVSLEPVYPASYSCSSFGFTVDGPSVQSTPTQDELEVAHYLSFCEGPKPSGPPWVISGDTGIHPSAAGYAQMASQVPAP